MSSEIPIPELAERIVDLVKATMSEIRPRLVQAALTGSRAENENLRHKDNFLSDHDLWMHQRVSSGFEVPGAPAHRSVATLLGGTMETLTVRGTTAGLPGRRRTALRGCRAERAHS